MYELNLGDVITANNNANYPIGIVIASGIHIDDALPIIYGVLVLLRDPIPRAANYLVGEWDGSYIRCASFHLNIVPAARHFDEQFGFWGES